jgi:hypothetical protein
MFKRAFDSIEHDSYLMILSCLIDLNNDLDPNDSPDLTKKVISTKSPSISSTIWLKKLPTILPAGKEFHG